MNFISRLLVAVVAVVAVAGCSGAKGADTEKEALHDFYSFYYSPDMASGEFGSYTGAMKQKFAEYGVTAQQSPEFSKSLSEFIKMVEDVSARAGEPILDYNLLWQAQDFVDNFDVNVKKVEVVDADHVTIQAELSHEPGVAMTYSLVKENGRFVIDDMADFRATMRDELTTYYFSYLTPADRKILGE